MSKHIVIDNKKGTVRYVADSTAMRKTELPEKILSYLDAMPGIKTLHLYVDQVEWLRKTASVKYAKHYGANSYQRLACEVLNITERNGISIIPIERES